MSKRTLKELILFYIAFLALLCVRQVLAGEVFENKLREDNKTRSYTLYRPDNLGDTPPLVLVLHGGLGNAEYTQRYGMNDIADREGFLVVYPEGSPIGRLGLLTRNRLVWNAGECCGRAASDDIDDVGFISRLLDHLVAEENINPDNIFITGMSNGGMMTYRLVCELPRKIAAAAPVAGTLTLLSCEGGTDVPVLHIHGMADTNVPLGGGMGEGLAKVEYRSFDETMTLITEKRACDPQELVTDSDGTEHISYHCQNGADVSALLLPGVEHTWPGMSFRNNEGGTLKAEEAVWDFFSMHLSAK